MPSSKRLLQVLLLIQAFCLTALAQSNSPVPQTGLLLHLDARAQAEELGMQPSADAAQAPSQGTPLARWSDLSPAQRNCLQDDATRQPRLFPVNDDWLVWFDGEDDFVQCLDQPTKLDAVTIFIVVAPQRNLGNFQGFFSAGARDGRDYQTGINIDMGPASSFQLTELNIEGPGFGGARNLFASKAPFGSAYLVECVVDPGTQQVQCWVDGKLTGSRPFQPTQLNFEHFTVGGRYYSNDNQPHRVQSTFQGAIADLLIYDHVLTDNDQKLIRNYLQQKHTRLNAQLPQSLGVPSDSIALEKVENPPLVKMLVPGFRVREIPVPLTNINSVRFRDDGKLVTLGYDGNIHLLSDQDGDGLEDTAEPYWINEGQLRGPIGLALTPPDYPYGQGMFVPSKGKVSFIVDHDGDDRADEERVIASGWQEIPQNVDAVGMAMDEDGALYFGLGTANYANAYLVDDQGLAGYDLAGDRGTVQRISPDLQSRETIATGIRFPIAFAFNEKGDLFCTDQEGATWLPNGNPFDELLHVQRDRHYGFPPRHPRYNPNVIDEPSVYNFSPQHQSTCGMIFNRPVHGGSAKEGPIFGPAWWRENAIVCGESRGKLWRTKLVESSDGYIATSELIACLQMLTVDACVAPDGDLVVACHSGPPDWGTGPTGQGKLLRIEFEDPQLPQPVLTYAASPTEFHVAFDRPLEPTQLAGWTDRLQVQRGAAVRPGDRYENLVPPYSVVQRQLLAPRYPVHVNNVSVTSDLSTLVVQTEPIVHNDHYAAVLPSLAESSSAQGDTDASLAEVGFSTHGVLAQWKPAADPAITTENLVASSLDETLCWLPHVDLEVSQQLCQPSLTHARFWQTLQQSGTLTLQTQVDVVDFLRPQIQPGSTLDFEYPVEQVTLHMTSNLPFSASFGGSPLIAAKQTGETFSLSHTAAAGIEAPLDCQIQMQCQTETLPQFSMAATTNEDDRRRAISPERFLLPWVKQQTAEDFASAQPPPELAGGDWGRGRRVFHSEAASCFKCHAVDGIGPGVGPDLMNLRHRDYASVLRDIRQPSYAINPDYLNQLVLLDDGRLLAGVVRTDNAMLLLTDSQGNTTKIAPHEIESMKPAPGSPMPEGLLDKLNDQQIKDLMTFLLTPPPSMPLESPLKAPPVRTTADVEQLLAGAVPLPEILEPLNIVLVAGPKDHGPGEHDYPAWQVRWVSLLNAAANVTVSTAWEFPDDDQLAAADVLIFFQKGAWNDHRAKQIDRFQARGGGAVYIHWAVNGDNRSSEFAQRIGLASKAGSIGYRHGPLTLDVHSTDHPIMRNLGQMKLYDESYWKLAGDPENVTLFASSVEEGQARPQVWAYERGPGRVFVSIPGHYSWTFDDPIFRTLLLRGIAWTAKQPVDRFNELVPLGARLK